MGRAGCAWVVAVLGSGCLQSPPAASGDAGSDSSDGSAGDILVFPPANAAVRIQAALAADVDSDGREDLVLLDNDVADDWAGLYILRAGPDGWTGIDEVRLDFRPTAGHFAGLLRAGGPALAVGGSGGKVALVSFAGAADYEVVPLEFEAPSNGAIEIIHSGLYSTTDPRASLLLFDGSFLYRSTPVDEASPMQLTQLNSGGFLDAAFWPLDGSDQATYIAARAPTKVEWYDAEGGGGMTEGGVRTARFAHLVGGLCGSYLAVGEDQLSLSIGSIACDGTSSALYPLGGATMDEIVTMAAGDLAGTLKRDVALVGYAGGSLVGQVLIDINFAVDSYLPETATATIPVAGEALPIFLTPVDAEGDDSALIYSVTGAGDIDCGRVAGGVAEPCPGRWQVRAR